MAQLRQSNGSTVKQLEKRKLSLWPAKQDWLMTKKLRIQQPSAASRRSTQFHNSNQTRSNFVVMVLVGSVATIEQFCWTCILWNFDNSNSAHTVVNTFISSNYYLVSQQQLNEIHYFRLTLLTFCARFPLFLFLIQLYLYFHPNVSWEYSSAYSDERETRKELSKVESTFPPPIPLFFSSRHLNFNSQFL